MTPRDLPKLTTISTAFHDGCGSVADRLGAVPPSAAVRCCHIEPPATPLTRGHDFISRQFDAARNDTIPSFPNEAGCRRSLGRSQRTHATSVCETPLHRVVERRQKRRASETQPSRASGATCPNASRLKSLATAPNGPTRIRTDCEPQLWSLPLSGEKGPCCKSPRLGCARGRLGAPSEPPKSPRSPHSTKKEPV